MENLKSTPPVPQVLLSFGLQGEPVAFADGLHGAFRVGECVLKKVDDPCYYTWLCEEVSSKQPIDIRIPIPVRSMSGSWVEQGWSTYRYLEGESLKCALEQKLEIAKKLHRFLQTVSSPPPWTNSPWSRAQSAVWGERPIDTRLSVSTTLAISKLLDIAGTNREPNQCVHCDLSGNILISELRFPAVIDLSLAYRPARFAEAILVYDSILWGGGSIQDAAQWCGEPANLQELARAAAFRLHVTAEFDQCFGSDRFSAELDIFEHAFGKTLEVIR